MRKRLERLTPGQERRLIEFRREWLAVGTSCEPADFAVAEREILNFYDRLGWPVPRFLRFSSPMMCELGIATLKRSSVGNQLGNRFRGRFGDQLWDQLWDQLGSQLWGQLWEQLRDRLRDQLQGQLRNPLQGQLWDEFRGQLWNQLRAQLQDQLQGQLGVRFQGQLGDQLRAQLQELQFLTNAFWGQHEVYWIAFYEFGLELGLRYDEAAAGLLRSWATIARTAGWWAPFSGICVLSDRPRYVSFDERDRLHRAGAGAIRFSDGWGVSAWHGVRVPDSWFDGRTLTPAVALGEANVERRRAACEIVGWENVLAHPSLNPVVIDADEPSIGTLVRVDLPDAPDRWFLRYRCATGRWFAEAVNDRTFNTALLANAAGNGWRPGFGDPESYIPFIRT